MTWPPAQRTAYLETEKCSSDHGRRCVKRELPLNGCKGISEDRLCLSKGKRGHHHRRNQLWAAPARHYSRVSSLFARRTIPLRTVTLCCQFQPDTGAPERDYPHLGHTEVLRDCRRVCSEVLG